MAQDSGQLLHSGTVIGFNAGNPDFAIVSDGSFTVHAFCNVTPPQLGATVQVYMLNNTYYVGTKTNG